jgi:hypothetical protein
MFLAIGNVIPVMTVSNSGNAQTIANQLWYFRNKRFMSNLSENLLSRVIQYSNFMDSTDSSKWSNTPNILIGQKFYF